jgi:hypothetical protein
MRHTSGAVRFYARSFGTVPHEGVIMWLVLGFGSLGALLGFMLGLTSESAVKTVIPLLFAFVGGSIFAALGKLSESDRKLAGRSVFALSVSCALGTVVGIVTNQYRLLSPHPDHAQISYENKDDDYLKNAIVRSAADEIDSEKQQGNLTTAQAYERMYKIATGKETAK